MKNANYNSYDKFLLASVGFAFISVSFGILCYLTDIKTIKEKKISDCYSHGGIITEYENCQIIK